jgi:hypothetical protein
VVRKLVNQSWSCKSMKTSHIKIYYVIEMAKLFENLSV